MNECMNIIANLFLIRQHQAHERHEYAAAIAYANALDLLAYALENREDCISQFDGYEEAKAMIENDFIALMR